MTATAAGLLVVGARCILIGIATAVVTRGGFGGVALSRVALVVTSVTSGSYTRIPGLFNATRPNLRAVVDVATLRAAHARVDEDGLESDTSTRPLLYEQTRGVIMASLLETAAAARKLALWKEHGARQGALLILIGLGLLSAAFATYTAGV